jgi:hypothetical protein
MWTLASCFVYGVAGLISRLYHFKLLVFFLCLLSSILDNSSVSPSQDTEDALSFSSQVGFHNNNWQTACQYTPFERSVLASLSPNRWQELLLIVRSPYRSLSPNRWQELLLTVRPLTLPVS